MGFMIADPDWSANSKQISVKDYEENTDWGD
jgi:hypothetical protein